MKIYNKITAGLLSSVACLTLSIAATPAHAVLNELLVTAQKREQNLQDVPVAVSAFDDSFLEATRFSDIFDLQDYTPGMFLTQAQTASQTTIILRGIGTSGNNAGLEPSVGVFVDGVFRSRSGAAIFDMPDLERVEVLRGPQGTLFGKNTTSGALNIVSKKPDYEPGGSAEISLGNLDYAQVRGTVTGPIVEGKIAGRLTASMTDREGFIDNVHLGTKINDRDRWGVKGQLLFNPNEDVEMRLIADYSEIDEKCCGASTLFNGPTDAALLGVALYAPFNSGITPNVLSEDIYEDKLVAINADPVSQSEDWGVSFQVDWDLGDVTLTSITGYRSNEFTGTVDADFTNLEILPVNTRAFEQNAFTQELRIQNNNADRFEWVAGVYYFQQDLDMNEDLRFGDDTNAYMELIFPALADSLLGLPSGSVAIDGPPGTMVALNLFPGGSGVLDYHEQEHESWAVFAQGTYDVTERLHATLGLRYTSEEKDLNSSFDEYPTPGGTIGLVPITVPLIGSTFAPFGTAAFGPTAPIADFTSKFEEEQLTGTAKLAFDVNDSVTAYASYSRGFKSGGTNVSRVAFPATPTFESEIADSYEIGFKGQFFDDRLRLNAAAFKVEYDDYQDNTFVGTAFILQNAGKVEVDGIEVEALATPTDWLTLQSAITYQDAEFESFVVGPCHAAETPDPITGGCDRSGDSPAQTPEWTVQGSATVTKALNDTFNGYARGEFVYRSDYVTDTNNDPRKVQDSFTIVNASFGVTWDDGAWDFSVWGKNLADEDYTTLAFDGVLQTGKLYSYPTEPRTWGVTLRHKF